MPDSNYNGIKPITALKDNPFDSWLCCMQHSKRDKNIISFLEKLFKGIYSQQKFVTNNIIRTDITKKNSKIKYNIIFKNDETSTAIIPLYLYPMPCKNSVCKFNNKYTQALENQNA